MTKSYKKEERLSPQARKLIEKANKISVYNGEKALDYLLSVEPRELNPYDRRKVGREILLRLNQLGKEFDDLSAFKSNYGIVTGEDMTYDAKHENMSERFLDKNSDKKEADELFSTAQKRVAKGEYSDLPSSPRYIWAENLINGGGQYVPDNADDRDLSSPLDSYMRAGKMYEDSGMFDKAIVSYQRALKVFKLTPIEISEEYSKKQLQKDLARVKKEKIELDKRKHRVGMQTSDLTSRLSLVIAIAGVLSGLFFLSPNITGNAIANGSQSSGSWSGIILFLIGIAGLFFYFRKKR